MAVRAALAQASDWWLWRQNLVSQIWYSIENQMYNAKKMESKLKRLEQMCEVQHVWCREAFSTRAIVVEINISKGWQSYQTSKQAKIINWITVYHFRLTVFFRLLSSLVPGSPIHHVCVHAL